MSAVKSGATPAVGTITISGTGNTLTSIASDINDTAWAELVGSVLTIKCRYITITGELIIGDANDFSVSEELRHLFTGTVNQNVMTVNQGGRFIMYGNTICDLAYNCSATQYPTYSTTNGYFKLQGNDTYKPTFKGARGLYVQTASAISEANLLLTGFILNKCIIGGFYDNHVAFWFQTSPMYEILIDDVIITQGIYTARAAPGIINYIKPSLPYSFDVPFKNVRPEATNAYFTFGTSSSDGFYWKDIDWQTTYTGYVFTSSVPPIASEFQTEVTSFYLTDRMKEQRKVGQHIKNLLENCQFSSSYANYFGYIYYGAVVLFKDCPTPPSNKRLLCYANAVALCWNSDHIYNNVALDDNMAFCRKVFKLDLTIQDLDGNNLNDCTIKVNQKDLNEEFTFRTDADGKIIAPFNLRGAILTNKIRLTSAETEYAWSDASNSTYHTVIVSKEGYKTETFNIVMSEDKEVTVQLRTLSTMYLGETEVNLGQLSYTDIAPAGNYDPDAVNPAYLLIGDGYES